MPAKSAPAGFKTPLLSPHRPPALDVPNGENKRKHSVDQEKSSPRVSDSRSLDGLGQPDVETPLRAGPRIATPEPKRSGEKEPGFFRRALNAVSPSGRHEQQKAESVESVTAVLKLFIKLADESRVTAKDGERAREALVTTPGKKPSSKLMQKMTGWDETALAKKTKADAQAKRDDKKPEATPAQMVTKVAMTILTTALPPSLDERAIAGSENYFNLLRPYDHKQYQGPKQYSGNRTPFYFVVFREVAELAVAKMEAQGMPMREAERTIDRLLDGLPKKLFGGEVWAHLTILRRVIRHEPESFGDSNSAGSDGVARQLFPGRTYAESVSLSVPITEPLLQDFGQRVEAIGDAVHAAVMSQLPSEKLITDMVLELDHAYAAIVQAFPDENSPQRLAMKVQCKQLVAHLQNMPALLNSPEELYGDFHTPLALDLFAEQVQAIRQQAAAATPRDPESLTRVVEMVIALAPAYAGIDKRLRYSEVPVQRQLLSHLCATVQTALSQMPQGMDWAGLPNPLADECQKAMTSMGIGFRPTTRLRPQVKHPVVAQGVAARIPESARQAAASHAVEEPNLVVPADDVFAARANRVVMKNDDAVRRVDGIDWSTLTLDDEPGEDELAG